MPHIFTCAEHRCTRLARSGVACSPHYKTLMEASTIDTLTECRQDKSFTGLSGPAHHATDSMPVAAVAAGATLYARRASQGVESHNSATLVSRTQDPVTWTISRSRREVHVLNSCVRLRTLLLGSSRKGTASTSTR